MAEMKILLSKVERIEPHDNADRLEIAFIDTNDFPVIISKGSLSIGEEVIHFPVDCVISSDLEEFILSGSKMKLSDGRIRASKIRGVVSYGIIVPAKKLCEKYNISFSSNVDYMKRLDCKKYEPPNTKSPKSNVKQVSNKNKNPFFDKYFDMNHLQNCKGIFKDDDVVVITEKLHGTSFRASYCRRVLKWWQKPFKRFFSQYEFVYGSRNVQLQDKQDKSLYRDIVDKYDLKNLLTSYPGYAIYGEIVGPNIQKGYDYTKELELYLYDIKITNVYQDQSVLVNFCRDHDLQFVPFIERCLYKDIPFDTIMSGSSLISKNISVKEGIVISSIKEEMSKYGRKKVKLINPEFLLNKNNTDFH